MAIGFCSSTVIIGVVAGHHHLDALGSTIVPVTSVVRK